MKKPLWIICTPRSGSSFLSHLLNINILNNNIIKTYPSFDEWFSSNHKIYQTINDFKINPISHVKALHIQFNRIFHPVLPFDPDPSIAPIRHLTTPTNDDRELVNEVLSNLRCIHLTRDWIDQTISYYMVLKANENDKVSYFYLSAELQKKFWKKIIEFDDEKAIKLLKIIKFYNQIWDNFKRIDDITISYEQLNQRPLETMIMLCKNLGYKYNEKAIENSVITINKRLKRAATSRYDIESYRKWMFQLASSLI